MHRAKNFSSGALFFCTYKTKGKVKILRKVQFQAEKILRKVQFWTKKILRKLQKVVYLPDF
jgi:hypothetical protein